MQMKVIPLDNIVQNFLWYVSSVFALIYMIKRIYKRLTLCAQRIDKHFLQFYNFVKQTQMELKPLDNIQNYFCYVSRSFGLQKYNKNP